MPGPIYFYAHCLALADRSVKIFSLKSSIRIGLSNTIKVSLAILLVMEPKGKVVCAIVTVANSFKMAKITQLPYKFN